jgi:glycosyltransferase involved in cell wall biosynthesis
VRRGLAAALDRGAVAVAFCDADGEYDPTELERLVVPILEGRADYVVGSRFAGTIQHMLARRRLGNQLLTRALAFVARTPIGDGQSGYRALSRTAAAAAVIGHDYNYAQVLTLDLLAKGYRYQEVPITYSYRSTGRSFVRPLDYLRRVIPAIWRQLNSLPDTATGNRDRHPDVSWRPAARVRGTRVRGSSNHGLHLGSRPGRALPQQPAGVPAPGQQRPAEVLLGQAGDRLRQS